MCKPTFLLISMNILITPQPPIPEPANTLVLSYPDGNKWLPLLRSDHFRCITLTHVQQLKVNTLTFLIQLSRLLRPEGKVTIKGNNQQLEIILVKLNLHQDALSEDGKVFLKQKPEEKVHQKEVEKKGGLAIGFKANEEEEEIDQSELMKEEGLNLAKKEENCETKPRACANCNCGRSKQGEKPISKEELVQKVNQGQPVSGCGKCLLGDSFRCGTCPYKGFPSFKPGDKLKLEEEGGIIVEEAPMTVSANGKVKLQL